MSRTTKFKKSCYCIIYLTPNGTAVLMRFPNIFELKQYLIALSVSLHSNLFEIVPVHMNKCKVTAKFYKKVVLTD